MYRIVRHEQLTPVTFLLEILAPEIAKKAQAGQFVSIMVYEKGERIPLTLADWDDTQGTITLVVQELGKTTCQMATLRAGDNLYAVAGPLGHPSEIDKYGTVVCVGGGVGIAAIYPIARALNSTGSTVLSVIGARSRELLFWEHEMHEVSDELIVCTDDGSYGRKALVTEPLADLLERGGVDRVWAVGPAIMMKFSALTAAKYETPIVVSLNPIMVDGTGMCGSCRVEVDGQTKFACVDGPEFDGAAVDWDLLMSRQRFYLDQERRALQRFRECSGPCHTQAEVNHGQAQ